MLQSGYVMFAPRFASDNQVIKKSTAWADTTLLEVRNETNVWIFTAYLDAILTLVPSTIEDLCPTRSGETNRHLLIGSIKEAIRKGLLLHGTRGLWMENTPFAQAIVGMHPLDLTTEPFSKRDPVALPLAITTMIGVPKTLGQGLSELPEQVIHELVT